MCDIMLSMIQMLIREDYLSKIREFYDLDIIKVLIGKDSSIMWNRGYCKTRECFFNQSWSPNSYFA